MLRTSIPRGAYDGTSFSKEITAAPNPLNDAEREDLLRGRDAGWSAALPPTTDYKERTEALNAPSQLKAGFYFLIASTKPVLRDDDDQVSSLMSGSPTSLWSFAPRQTKNLEGFAPKPNSGEA